MRRIVSALTEILLVSVIVAGGALVDAASAGANVGLSVHTFVTPSQFSASDEVNCNKDSRCDRYQLVVRNVGDTASASPVSEPVEVTDRLPAGITTTGKEEVAQKVSGEAWECTAPVEAPEQVTVVKCHYLLEVPPQGVTTALAIPTTAPSADAPTLQHGACLLKGKKEAEEACVEKNEIEVTGGGAPGAVTAMNATSVSSEPQLFELTTASLQAEAVGGGPDTAAGERPDDVTTSLEFANVFQPAGVGQEPLTQEEPVENPRAVVVELPAGFIGDPQATPVTCPDADLVRRLDGPESVKTACPPASRVGILSIDSEGHMGEESASSGEFQGPTSIYEMTPQAGYPAVFGFQFAEKSVFMYATLVHTPAGYRVRVSAPGIVAAIGIVGVSLTFFGDPAAEDEGTSGDPHTAFLTNPADCSAGPLATNIEADSWENPGRWVSKVSTTYPQITECNLLQFEPKLAMAPAPSTDEGTSRADTPSAYDVSLEVPQKSLFEESATPDLKDATVTLPEGVSVSPSAAEGLTGCEEHGPNGIDIPESTSGHEVGEGEEIGPDGLPHMTAGHCPDASTLGTVRISTPVLKARCGGAGQPACKEGESPAPLQGHVYLAQPKCGGPGQPACTAASATNGELYGLYLEAEDHQAGVIVKIPGIVSANPVTGQLTGRFTENPQLPFEKLELHFHGGARAPLANPQACGSYATSSTLTSWAGQEQSGVSPSFGVDWDGKGGACPASLPFSPGFTVGTTPPTAAAFSPVTLSLTRQDREQDLSRLSVTAPPGLLAKIAGVPQCPETQANAGTCPEASQIGTVTVGVGSGPNPFHTAGKIYFTGPYNGAPFGASVVVPAVAGPFNLGNVVVRASFQINPTTAQAIVVSNPFPTIIDGVPLRIKSVNVALDRPGFTLNPTNCAQQSFASTVTAQQGAVANISTPFAVTGCASLPFKPTFTASTLGHTSKQNGASLHVKITSGGIGQANIAKVDLTIPKILPSRLTTLQKACTEAQFNADAAGCPAASRIATATVHTPLLSSPLSGPVYFVSHGGAAFPDTEIILQGEGVTLILDGKTQIKNGVTFSRFESVPDAPFTSFEFNAPQGPFSIFGANGNLCQTEIRMPTTIVAQNGAVVNQNTLVEPEGCPNSITILSHEVHKHTLTLKVAVPSAGKLTATGKGLSKAAKDPKGRSVLTLTLKAKDHHKLKTKVKLSFAPASGKKLGASVGAQFRR